MFQAHSGYSSLFYVESLVEGAPRWRIPFPLWLHNVIRWFCSTYRTRVVASTFAQSTVFMHKGHPVTSSKQPCWRELADCVSHYLSKVQKVMENKLVTQQGMQAPAIYFPLHSLRARDGPWSSSTTGMAGNLFTKGTGASSEVFAWKWGNSRYFNPVFSSTSGRLSI